MPSGFGELTDQAHHLVSTGDLAGAQRLLADALTDADPRPANATPELAEAAGLQARVLVALGEPHSARGWAAFAYAAANRLHGRSDQRTVAAAATLAAVLHRVGSWSRAARLYQEVIIELTALDGPESLRVLAAHADLATVEYARGQCQVARDRLQDAWELHREVYGDGHPSGIKMLARLGGMQRDCGQFAEAHDNLALARELCRQHLPADDPLAAQVATLARAAANPDHVCADTAPVGRDGPIVPSARTPPPGDAPTAFHPSQPGYRPAGADPYEPDPYEAAADQPHPVPTPRQPAEDPARGWWPPEPAAGERPADSAVPPSVVPLAGADEADGVYRVHRHGPPEEPHGPAEEPHRPPEEPYGPPEEPHGPDHRHGAPEESYRPSRLLPVPVHRAPTRRDNRLLPLVVGGVAVVLLGTAAVIAGVAGMDGDDEPPPTATGAPATGAGTAPPATTAAPTAGVASPGTPPGGVTLRDNRDNVALRWTYPAGGEGPVVISGGRVGQAQTAFANLPAGTTDFVVYGLNRSTDYCFTVAVVWSTDSIARAEQVCTDRR
ncbi:Tetratricopeptide repeat-containing protein [Micromonospora citrea]|uniref:Tetratricopeptide repeat-containing protein n=1 Tax=Micromonospora citrea TaxID=47855 RepID=A0A1C6U674_9ACTN|nr:tetratricopeptide repeat protein [Micromonospora citrea]SCL49527.1 Tetratricopeptide repeat-containing protein [Micromonospora citrea]